MSARAKDRGPVSDWIARSLSVMLRRLPLTAFELPAVTRIFVPTAIIFTRAQPAAGV